MSNRNQLEYTEIIPSGAFTYTADSGFSGSASRIRVLPDSRQQTLQRDSGNQGLLTGRKADNLEKAQSQNRQSRQAQEKESQPGYHSYLLPAGVLLLAGFIFTCAIFGIAENQAKLPRHFLPCTCIFERIKAGNMEKPFTLTLTQAPQATFRNLEKLPEDCEHPIRYAAASRLQHADADVLCQVVTGWQFYAELYTFSLKAAQDFQLQVHEPCLLFGYLLQGGISLYESRALPVYFPASRYAAVYLPAGWYHIHMPAGKHTAFYFALSYGYLYWLCRHHPTFLVLCQLWKAQPRRVHRFPLCQVDYAVKRNFADVKNCPKRGNELDGALRIYWARFLAMYQGQWQLQQEQLQHSNEEKVRRVMAYLKEHFTEPDITRISKLAKHFGFSNSTLMRVFEQQYGHRILQEVTRLRMELAKQLLADKKRPLAAIATDLGYEYKSSFSRAFRAYTGLYPTPYRNMLP